ncbi:high-potential iron-sulfur protein [Rheinheimera baltica]|uniref:High-potential iron-sulfur protein n=1 Tax=Rheinheimera baltica TaxID=67576 RepID=A0ABT9HTZ2_9GAMM|nr:high-potential iron-sulfur protein [Rheinheimera baltica]MDP5134604.1 high-potential iron-sulfur protein [Rheinheimera baltica]
MTTSRRRFLKLSAGGIVGLSVGGVSLRAFAAEHVDPENPQAKALQYVHKSAKEGQNCANCILLQGNAGEAWRPCGVFPGKLVNAEGWCAAWAKKPG